MASFREVSKDRFFAIVGPMNVHPRSEPDVTYWETPRREVIGKSFPGYLCNGPKRWFLSDKSAEA